MALANYVVPLERIELPDGGEFVVRGLALNDVMMLVLEQKDSLEHAFNFVEKNNLHLGQVNGDIGLKLLRDLPTLAAKLVALAAREPEEFEKVGNLPAPVQLDALEKVARLTFKDAAGFRAFVGKLTAAVQSAQGVLPQPEMLAQA